MTPLTLLSAVIVLGVVTAQLWSPERPWVLGLTGTLILGYAAAIASKRRRLAASVALIAACSLGWSLGAREAWNEPVYKPAEHILQGRIEEQRPPREGRSRIELRLAGATIIGKDGRTSPLRPTTGRLHIWLDGDEDRDLWRGDEVLFRVGPPRYRGPRNFGDRGGLTPRPARASVVAGPLLVERGSGWMRTLSRIRRHLRRRVELSLAPPSRGLVLALSLGDRSELSAEDVLAFRRSGTAHLLAVSGLHVTLVGGFVFWLTMALLARTPFAQRVLIIRPAAIAAILACWGYAMVTGLGPSAFRAAVMLSFSHAASVAGRPTGRWRAICLAAAVLAIHDPTLVWSAGFQLSFVAVLALIGLEERSHDEKFDGDQDRESLVVRAWRGMWRLVKASAVATAATAPLLLHHFGQVSLWGLIVNVVAVPLTGAFVLPGSLLVTAIGGMSSVVGRWLGWLVGLALDLFLAGLRWAGSLPTCLPPLARPSLVEAAALSFSVLLLVRRRSRIWGGILLLSMCAVWVARLEAPRLRRHLVVSFLDVGAGDATLIRFPDGRRWLVDTGPLAGTSTWSPPVVAAVQRTGFGRLDVLALTHRHLDHAAGVPTLLERIGAERYWSPSSGVGGDPDPLARAAEERGSSLRRGMECGSWMLPGEVRVEALHPCRAEDAGLTENDRSLVLRLTYGDVALLLPGDIEIESERILVERSSELRATVLKLPHHGSETSSSEGLLDVVRPEVAIGSCARSRRRRLPDASVESRLHGRGVLVLSTAELGAIRLTTDGERIRFDTARVGRLDLPLGR